MSETTESPAQPVRSAADLLRPPPLRRDVSATPQTYLGRDYLIYKNPISLAFFRLPRAHGDAASLFDGRKNLGQITELLRGQSNYWRALKHSDAVEELASLAGQMASAGLLHLPGARARERVGRLSDLKRRRWFERGFAQTMYFRRTLLDPDAFLSRLLPWFGWVFRPGVVWLLLLFVGATFVAVVWNYDRLLDQGGNFFTFSNLGLAWLLFLVVKIIHELGHGVTAKRFGAEVHEMGFMFILFAPYLFCNVSDAWRLPKRGRIAVGSAGIVVEVFLAAVAGLLWLITQPGLFNQVCFNVMILCSVSTVLLNGNPLLKFDGYYILADLCEVPNLRDKSNAWINNWAQRRLLGLPVAPLRTVPGEVGALFGVYAAAAYIYMWVILFAISIALFNLLQPYGLEIVSRAYVLVFLFVSLALPLYRLVHTVWMTEDLRRAAGNRLFLGAGAAAAAVVFMFFVPWRDEIKRSAVLEHAEVRSVSAAAEGFVKSVAVRSGQQVAEGEVLATLDNAYLQSELEGLLAEKDALAVRLRSLAATPGEEARLALPVLQRQLGEVEAQVAGTEEKLKSLELRAPFDGLVRTPRPQELVGKFFPARQPILQIGKPSSPRLLIALDESQARRVRQGLIVKAVFDALPGEVFSGTVSAVPASPAPRFSAASLANLFGGDVPSQMDPASKGPVPSLPHYEAEASLEISPLDLGRLRAQSSGRATIRVKQTNLAGWLGERLTEMIHPDVRL